MTIATFDNNGNPITGNKICQHPTRHRGRISTPPKTIDWTGVRPHARRANQAGLTDPSRQPQQPPWTFDIWT
jgi:hypothetical protein